MGAYVQMHEMLPKFTYLFVVFLGSHLQVRPFDSFRAWWLNQCRLMQRCVFWGFCW